MSRALFALAAGAPIGAGLALILWTLVASPLLRLADAMA